MNFGAYSNMGPLTPFFLLDEDPLVSLGAEPWRETIFAGINERSGLERSDKTLAGLSTGSPTAVVSGGGMTSSAMACNRTTARNSIRRRLICSRP